MNRFSQQYPDFAAIERHIRRAQAERAVAIASALANAIVATVRGIRRLAGASPAPAPRAANKRLVVRARAA